MSVLHANRSACLYNLQEYEASLEDISSAFALPYPKNIHHKLYERRAKCHMAYHELEPALDSFRKALTSLDDSKLDTNAKMKKSNDFTIMIELLTKSITNKTNNMQKGKDKKKENTSKLPVVPQLSRESNKKYPSASNSVDFDSNPKEGRFAIAAERIEAGNVNLFKGPPRKLSPAS